MRARDFYYILDNLIREEIDKNQKIAIYPLGKIGLQAKEILTNRYGCTGIIIDNVLARYNCEIMDIGNFQELDDSDITIILCASDPTLNKKMMEDLKKRKIKACIRNVLEVPCIVCPEKEEYFLLIQKLCQVKKVVGHELVRVGASGDGGYIMLNDFKDVSIAYSFGIGRDVSWDEWIAQEEVSVYCYDHTIEKLPVKNDRLIFNKIGISGEDYIEKGLLSMTSILCKNGHEREQGLILKMDVEGAEWEFINSTSPEILNHFSQMTFELHDLNNINNKLMVIAALEKLNKTHQAVWIHANNNGVTERAGKIVMPSLLEITYVNKEQYAFIPTTYNCPINIDAPNVESFLEVELNNWGSLEN